MGGSIKEGKVSSDMLAFILLDNSQDCALSMVAAAMVRQNPLVQVLDGGAVPLLMRVGNALATVHLVDAPVPLYENDVSVAGALGWPDAWKSIQKQQAHLVLSINNSDSSSAAALLLQQLVGATLEGCFEPLAVVFPAANTVWRPALVQKAAATGELVTPLFVSVQITFDPMEPGTMVAQTQGLQAFNLMEIEVNGFAGSTEQLYEFVQGLASYLITHGAVLKQGDTVGPDNNTKVPVQLMPSAETGRMVYRLIFSQADGAKS